MPWEGSGLLKVPSCCDCGAKPKGIQTEFQDHAKQGFQVVVHLQVLDESQRAFRMKCFMHVQND